MSTLHQQDLRSQVSTILTSTVMATPCTQVQRLAQFHPQRRQASRAAARTRHAERLLDHPLESALVATYADSSYGRQYALIVLLEKLTADATTAQLLAHYCRATWQEGDVITGFAQTIVVVGSDEPVAAIRMHLAHYPELKSCLEAGLITIWPRALITQLNAQINNKPRAASSTTPRPTPRPMPYSALLLGYVPEQTKVYELLSQAGYQVAYTAEMVTAAQLQRYDLVLSYGYRHLLKSDLLAALERPIINLHIALLPFNRGAAPNFWSFYENTPSGVTMHLIDAGTDTGPILAQRIKLWAAPKLTTQSAPEIKAQYERTGGAAVGFLSFARTYTALRTEMEALLAQHLNALSIDAQSPLTQLSGGTYHKMAQLPAAFSGYDATIATECARLHQEADS